MAQTLNGATINKLTLAQYKSAKASNLLKANELYVISDIDEQLDSLLTYKESLNVKSPIILRNLNSGLYKIKGYFKCNSNQSGISGVDPFAYVMIDKSSSVTYATVIDSSRTLRYSITNTTYQDLDDTGWIDATLTNDFIPYANNSDNKPKYRKKNGVVYIRGCVSPSTELEASATGKVIFTLPTGYRTTYGIVKICQGSGKNVWCLAVNTNGTVTISRYGTTANAKVPTTAWLPFEISFAI